MREYQRPRNIYRLNNVLRAKDIRIAYHLYVVVSVGRNLGNYRCYVLIDVCVKYCLNQEYVCIAFNSLENSQVVNISVSVEVKV